MLPKINFYSILFIVALVSVLGFSIAPVDAETGAEIEQQEDYAHEIAEAKKRWIAEHGDAQPNLTPESEKYLKEMTVFLHKK